MKAAKLANDSQLIPTASRWENYLVEVKDNKILAIHLYPGSEHFLNMLEQQ